MGLISALIDFISKGIKYIVVFILIIFGICFFVDKTSGRGTVKSGKKVRGYYEVIINDNETGNKSTFNFIDKTKLKIDGVEYSYNFTKVLKDNNGYYAFELAIKKADESLKHIRIAKGKNIHNKESHLYEFINRLPVTKDSSGIRLEDVDSSKWNEKREYLPSMEKEVFDYVFTKGMEHSSFTYVIF